MKINRYSTWYILKRYEFVKIIIWQRFFIVQWKKPGWSFVVSKTYLIMQYMHCHYNLHRVLHYKDCFTFPGIMDSILSSAYACHYLNYGSLPTQAWKPNMEVIFWWHLNCNTSITNRSKKTLFITDCRWCGTVYYIVVNLTAFSYF